LLGLGAAAGVLACAAMPTSGAAEKNRELPRGKETVPAKKGLSDTGGTPRILVAATGSVASVKVPELVEALIQCFGEATQIKVVTTPAGAAMLRLCQGYNPSAWTKMVQRGVAVLVDADEWEGFDDIRTDKVVHIELRRWADCLIIAPCSACTLSKLATGVCDNLLTSLARAWDPSKALILAPAMNTVMWEHPTTALHLETLRRWGFVIVPPAVKLLVCNQRGTGALAEVGHIVEAVDAQLSSQLEAGRAHTGHETDGIGAWPSRGFPSWTAAPPPDGDDFDAAARQPLEGHGVPVAAFRKSFGDENGSKTRLLYEHRRGLHLT